MPGQPVGRVTGTEDATPLQFSVALAPQQYLQLDDVVTTARSVPGIGEVRTSGVVTQVVARHEGTNYGSDVFLVADGVLPALRAGDRRGHHHPRRAGVLRAADRRARRSRRATGEERAQALYFDKMDRKVPVGKGRDGDPIYLNLEFLDGTRGGHVSISGISGVATKTSFALFLLYSIFQSGVLGKRSVNAKALVFSVKGEDLLFLDHRNPASTANLDRRLRRAGAARGRVRLGGLLRPADARTTRAAARSSRAAPAASPRSGGPSPSSAPASCCPTSSPTPRTSATSTRW